MRDWQQEEKSWESGESVISIRFFSQTIEREKFQTPFGKDGKKISHAKSSALPRSGLLEEREKLRIYELETNLSSVLFVAQLFLAFCERTFATQTYKQKYSWLEK